MNIFLYVFRENTPFWPFNIEYLQKIAFHLNSVIIKSEYLLKISVSFFSMKTLENSHEHKYFKLLYAS